MDVSKKCSRFKEDYNLKQINELYYKNEAKDIINILEKTVKNFYMEYISENNKIEGFNLDDDVKKIEIKYNDKDKEYAGKFRNTAMNLIQILSKKGRIKKY